MAKILFSCMGYNVPNDLCCYYDQFVNALRKAGNEVLVITSNNLIINGWHTNNHFPYLDSKKLDKYIINFNPDLVIAANNVLYSHVPKILDCPIVIFGADKPIGYADKNEIATNVDRYHFIFETQDCQDQGIELFNPKKSNMAIISTATDLVAEDLEQDKNISFIGTNFTSNAFRYILKNLPGSEIENFEKFYSHFKNNLRSPIESILKDIPLNQDLLKKINKADLLNIYSGNKRVQTLSAICDLGLSLHGYDSWLEVFTFSMELAICYKKERIFNSKENQDLYNRSKIAINITHEQALDNFSWRVRDIMATNACLVSDERKNLDIYFGKYVKIPTFDNPYDARKLCEKLLKDNIWRKEIVAGSQLAIEEGHRFKHRFKDIEEFVGVKLLNNNTISNENYDQVIILNSKTFHSRTLKSLYKIKNKILKKNGIIRKTNRARNRLIRKVKLNFLK